MKREKQFIHELQQILQNEPGQHLHVNKKSTFKEIYNQLQPIMKQLRIKYELEQNPVGTNTEIILFQSTLFSTWYDKNILTKPKPDPNRVLAEGLETLFEENTKYTYTDGRTIFYYKGKNTIPRIKRDILQEFGMLEQNIVMFKVQHMLRVVKSRFS